MAFGLGHSPPPPHRMDARGRPFDLMGHKLDPVTPWVDSRGPKVTPYDME